jgi:hypothetical protein
MTMFHIRASIRRDPLAVRHFAITGLLDGSAESDHRLAWSVVADDPAAKRDFVFKVISRDPFAVEMLSSRKPSVPDGLWDIKAKEVDLRFEMGSVHDIATTAVLMRSARPGSPDGRGKKHDLVSAVLHDLRSGNPAPEVAHLSSDAKRQDVVRPAAMYWFWRAGPRLGFELVQGDGGEPLCHAEISNASRARGSLPGCVPSIRAIDVRTRVKVTDPVAFSAMLTQGIGSAKSYGYGMVKALPATGP